MGREIQLYEIYEQISELLYGKLYRGISITDKKQYAIMAIKIEKITANKKIQELLIHEINIHNNIQKNIHFITFFQMQKTRNYFYFVYEYCKDGTLQNMLQKQQSFDQIKSILIFKQLLQAFQAMSRYTIMHRNLKPSNIFFKNGVLKIGDFGFCKNLQEVQIAKKKTDSSPIYMSPQVLNGQIYSKKADIWSMGVILYQMLYGFCPFTSTSLKKLINLPKQPDLQFPTYPHVSPQLKNLLKKMLTKDVKQRIQWSQLFKIKISNQGKFQSQINNTCVQKNILQSNLISANDQTIQRDSILQQIP